MRWLFAKDEIVPLEEIETTSAAPITEVHPSPGLVVALSHLHEDRPCTVLDLGPAVAENVAFLSRFPCRLHIVDLLGVLADEPNMAERLETDPDALFAEVLPSGGQTFDLILAWNLFDHFEPDAARHLARRLADLTHGGSRLLAILSAGRSDDASGLSFAISGHDSLEYRPVRHPAPRPGPYNPAAFAQMLAGFAVDHSVVLRHGFHEFVAVRQ